MYGERRIHKGWRYESYRHSLAAKGMRSSGYLKSLGYDIILEEEGIRRFDFAKKVKRDPYEFQDTNQEKIVHADWWGGRGQELWKDNELRFVLEGSGDIFREYSIHKTSNWWFAQNYIDEKAARIKRYLTMPSLADHDVSEENKAKLAELRRLWTIQPRETELQKKAIDLNLAIIDKDTGKAISILKEITKYESL